MCGLVGVVAKSSNGFFKYQCEMFHELLYVDNFRGDDSTGVFMVDRWGDLELIKEASASPDFIRTKSFHTMMANTLSRGRAIIGHNRKATKGEIIDANAHPFVVDNKIVLVHNGTLYGDYKKLAGEGNDVDVDSHAIAHVIHQKGDNVEEAIQEINGAFALIWFDMEKQTLNFLRNSQRPLHYIETNNEWVWASEKNMLDWMVSRHNLTGKVCELPAGTLTTFSLAEGKVEVASKPLQLHKSYTTTTTGSGSSANEPDYCGYDASFWGGPMNPNACAWQDWEGEGGQTTDTPDPRSSKADVEALRAALQAIEERDQTPFEAASKAIVEASRPNKPRVTTTANLQHRIDEEQLAMQNNCHVFASDFNKLTAPFEEGKRYRITCVDYNYVNRNDYKNGFLLYGFLGANSDIIVRVFMNDEYPEIMLVDWTTNCKDIGITLSGKVYRTFDDKDYVSNKGDGFIMFHGRDPRSIKFDPPKVEEATHNGD